MLAAVVLAILAEFVVILKLGLRNISKRIVSFIFLNVYIPLQHALDSFNSLSFKIIDKANSKFDLNVKEALHINWRKPALNAQQKIIYLSLFRYSFRPPCLFFSFAFLFYLLFSLPLTLIISIFYCLNYFSLLLHLITTRIVSCLSLSSIIFSISTLIIGIFYSLNWILLLVDLIIIHLVNIFYNNYVINICPGQL